jgi:hypothetical protein
MPHTAVTRQVTKNLTGFQNLSGLHFHYASDRIAFQARKFYYAIGTVLVTTLVDIVVHLFK